MEIMGFGVSVAPLWSLLMSCVILPRSWDLSGLNGRCLIEVSRLCLGQGCHGLSCGSKTIVETLLVASSLLVTVEKLKLLEELMDRWMNPVL